MHKVSVLTTSIALFASVTCSVVGDTVWNQWRGPRRDGKSADTGLIDSWDDTGPPLVWQTRGLGRGYASVAVVAGRIYTLGARDGKEQLVALDARDGRLIWQLPFGGGDHSNGTPVVDGNMVWAIGLEGDLIAADAATGRRVWSKSLRRDFGGQMMSGWGYSESPLVDGNRLVSTPGAKNAMLVALDKQTGEVIWRTTVGDLGPRGQDGAGYSSIVVSNGAGVRQYVQLTGRGLIGVRARDGKLLWNYNRVANDTANIPTPVVFGDHVFTSAGYGAGAALLELTSEGDGVAAREVYFLPASTFQNHHGGMILSDGYLFAGHNQNNGFPICIDIMTGQVVWGGDRRGPGQGSAAIAYADGHLVFRYQNGLVAWIEATADEYRLKGTFQPVYQEAESWAHPVIAGGRLYLREQDVLMCYDLRRR